MWIQSDPIPSAMELRSRFGSQETAREATLANALASQ
jgi:hypothetical protein